ncbi:DUF4202 family protein [Candidatus Woesearchaeota archaeon]|nr:DUF4202 family protein [Candidatus Woesearchaeota archaeon]
MLDKVMSYVNKSFEQCVTSKSVKHFENAVYWVKKLKPDADEAVLIAAYSHDIQRAFRKTNTSETFKILDFNNPALLEEHQEEGARLISDFLKKEGYDEKNIQRVYNMVRHHEEGGDEESNLIKDADSISYFETNSFRHIKHDAPILGKEKVRGKIEWMYNRISSKKARKIAEPMYKKALKLLESC